MDLDLIRRAKQFAIEAHGDQKRKYTGDPYWFHLQHVATILLRYSATAEVVCAGWLHDTLEDTAASYQELCMRFGHDIANLVVEVTDVSRKDSGNTPEGMGNRALRKAIDRQYLAGASWRGQMVKCADTISNTGDIVVNDLDFARETYIPEKVALIPVLSAVRVACFPLWKEASDVVERAYKEVLHATAA
jgi:(p)ppGpp synthase/HD superfamily hydrolase